MDAKRYVAGFLTSLLLLSAVCAQDQPMSAPIMPPPSTSALPPSGPSAPITLSLPGAYGGYDVPGISNWISRETSPCCNGPVGGNSEVGTELYFRAGPSLPLGDSPLLSRNLAAGFTVAGGAKTLFYNHPFTEAWYIDTGISNSENSALGTAEPITFNTAVPGRQGVAPFTVTLRNVNRTFVNLGAGYEWFSNPAKDQPVRGRFAIDGGGRYGTMSVRLNELTHRSDVIGGAYVGAQYLLEYVCWHSILNVGVRTEYSYTWSDMFRRASDIGELNILVNLGVRY
jgi:hypothetical protein